MLALMSKEEGGCLLEGIAQEEAPLSEHSELRLPAGQRSAPGMNGFFTQSASRTKEEAR